MKSVISTTFDDTYLFYLPITTWCWNKLGVDVICFMPKIKRGVDSIKIALILDNISNIQIERFDCHENKEPTYAQCARIYAAALDLPEDEIMITSDIDMLVFRQPEYKKEQFFVYGHDLTPEGQYPICYLAATVKSWRSAFDIKNKTPQQCLDVLLGNIECDNMRGNYWCKDQEEVYKNITGNVMINLIARARPGTQFASNRIDRDDAFWEDRLSPDIVDYHMHRPGYTEENFKKILTVIQYFYPNENLDWMKQYRNKYVKLIK